MPNELFATKGIEYLLVISYLLLLVALRGLIFPRRKKVQPERDTFQLADGLFYHQGHTWAKPERDNFVRVGMDDLAQALVGEDCHVMLPHVGAHVEEGEPGWQVHTHGQTMPMLSPVDGDVVAVNNDVLHNPQLLHEDPYERGWLMEIRVPHPETTRRNLLSGGLAEAWMEDANVRLHEEHGPWEALAREIFLLEEAEESVTAG